MAPLVLLHNSVCCIADDSETTMPSTVNNEAGANLLLSLASSGAKSEQKEPTSSTEEGIVTPSIELPPREGSEDEEEDDEIEHDEEEEDDVEHPPRVVSESSIPLASSPWGSTSPQGPPGPSFCFYAPYPPPFYHHPMMHMSAPPVSSQEGSPSVPSNQTPNSLQVRGRHRQLPPSSPKETPCHSSSGHHDTGDIADDKRVISPTLSEKDETTTPQAYLAHPYAWTAAYPPYGYYPYPPPAAAYPPTPLHTMPSQISVSQSQNKRKKLSSSSVTPSNNTNSRSKKSKTAGTGVTRRASKDESTPVTSPTFTAPSLADSPEHHNKMQSVPFYEAPSRCNQEDDGASPPAFVDVINYKDSNSGSDKKTCVMCGHARLVSVAKSPATAEGVDYEYVIPRQNKGVCTACDVTVWVLQSNGRHVKWCKGCKNFRYWASFGLKGAATKCCKCRDRQKHKYAEQKKTLQTEYDVALQLNKLKQQK